jgi:hypothetical protein
MQKKLGEVNSMKIDIYDKRRGFPLMYQLVYVNIHNVHTYIHTYISWLDVERSVLKRQIHLRS